MAHAIKVRPVPHRNKDGRLSKTKKDWIVVCRSRGKVCHSEICQSQSDANDAVKQHREIAFLAHLSNHPNDIAFRHKHVGAER